LNYKNMSDNKYNTVIVGGGIAGLTSAAYLSRAGQKILLIEKNRECGGLVNSFTRDGFHFDAGVRALEDAGIIFPMLKDLGIRLEVIKSPVSLGIENEIIHIEGQDSLLKYRELLVKLFPESKEETDNVIRIIRKIMKHMDVLYGIENPVFKDLMRDRTFVFKRLLPWLPQFIFTVRKINRLNMPVEDYLENFVKNSSLRDIISQHFFKKTPAFFAMSYFSLYLDYFYPKGGVGKLPEALQCKIIECGGEILTNTMITEVMAEERLLKDQNNSTYRYDNLIWAADLKTLYRITETEGLSQSIKALSEDTKNKFLKNRGGDSVFSLFVEVDEPLESFRKIANGHFFYTPSKLGLGETHRAELDDLISNFEIVDKGQILTWLDKFTRLNTYEISIPGLKDPELVPPGKTGLIVSFLAEYDLFKKIKEAGWLDEFISELENRVLRVISDSVYPMLKDKIITHFSFTPLSIENRVGSSEGAITGWSFQESMPVVNKIQNSGRSVLTPIPSIYQAGQWAYSPAGVPMSILTGKLAADQVLKQIKKSTKPGIFMTLASIQLVKKRLTKLQ
jgi:phytoene dehydrogenase-like protein